MPGLDFFIKYSPAIMAYASIVIAFFSLTTFILSIVILVSSIHHQNALKKLTRESKLALLMIAGKQNVEGAKRIYDEFDNMF